MNNHKYYTKLLHYYTYYNLYFILHIISYFFTEQEERFPCLKDAPTEGSYSKNVKLTHKPLGIEIRNVKCIRCGDWGHQSGDRECPLRDV